MKGKRVLAILTSLVLTVGTLSVGAYAADGGGAASTTGKAAQAAAENPCAEGHDYVVKETAEPTCEKDGYTVYVCTRCEDTYTEKVDALDHDYQASETVAPTCEEDGYTVYTCTRCGDNYTEEGKKALGHAYKATETVAPTCEEDGYTVYTCTRCGDSYTDNEKEALGHKYKETARKDPTCTKKGSVTYTCSNCGDSYKEGRAGDLEGLHQATNATKEWFYIQKLNKGQKAYTELYVKFDGESEVNDYMDTYGKLMVAYAVELDKAGTGDSKKAATSSTRTGDPMNLLMTVLAMTLSLLLAVLLIMSLRRDRKDGEQA